MIIKIMYIAMILFAVMAMQTPNLRNGVIYLSVFSLLCSVVYLFLGAPDVAIAEATIGCTLATILYLVAIKKYKIFTIYYKRNLVTPEQEALIDAQKEQMMVIINDYIHKHELQLEFIPTTSKIKDLHAESNYDMIIIHSHKGAYLYGAKNSYLYVEMIACLEALDIPIHSYN